VFQNVTDTKNRAFLATTLGGTVIGGTLAWWLTRDGKPKAAAESPIPGMPTAGVIGVSETRTGVVPAYGLGWTGSF
jgi:hypothetical protein